jgi:hypothetical protein
MRKTVIPYPIFGLKTLIFNKAIFYLWSMTLKINILSKEF